MVEDTSSCAAIEQFIYRECRLLDSRNYEEWLTLFEPGALYWVPVDDGDDEDPGKGISIIYDDDARRAERVYRTLHTPVLDQNPSSRTLHMVSNVEVEPEDDYFIVRCYQLIVEMRPGPTEEVGLGTPRFLGCDVRYHLVSTGNGEFRIAQKKVVLIDRDRPQFNLSFVV